MRKEIIAVMFVSIVLFSMGTASAGTQLTVDPSGTLDIPFGEEGEYTITLTTDYTSGTLYFETDNENLYAKVVYEGSLPACFANSGSVELDNIDGSKVLTLIVFPSEHIETHQVYETTLMFYNENNVAKAMVTAGSNPVPELATILLVSAGLIGLLGLVRRRRSE